MKKIFLFTLFLSLSFAVVSFAEKSIEEGSECVITPDCGVNQTCSNGKCLQISTVECTTDEDCTLGRKCYNGQCGPIPKKDIFEKVCGTPLTFILLSLIGVFWVKFE